MKVYRSVSSKIWLFYTSFFDSLCNAEKGFKCYIFTLYNIVLNCPELNIFTDSDELVIISNFLNKKTSCEKKIQAKHIVRKLSALFCVIAFLLSVINFFKYRRVESQFSQS